MTADPVLVLGWLIMAHLVADFVLQTDAIVADKVSAPRHRRWRGLLAHGAIVGGCLLPFVGAFGVTGLWAVVALTASHVVIDRWKVRATRDAEARALAVARRRQAEDEPGALGPGWTPMPAALFILDQLLHAVAIVAVWAVFLAVALPIEPFVAAMDRLLGGWNRAVVHAAALTGVVVASLVVVNVRAGAFFVATLVRPRESVEGHPMPDEIGPEPRPRGWRVRIGPIEAVASPDLAEAGGEGTAASGASPARIGATIGILERLLIVTLVVTGAATAIGFVIAAKTIARFKQLDNRDFAEYYLLGTLASVSVAVGSGLLASAALQTLR